MDLKRLWCSFRMFTFWTGLQRTDYLKKKDIFGKIGENVMLQSRKIPLYPERIFFGNNIRVASNVSFITHDVVHNMFNNLPEIVKGEGYKYKEKIGTITIGDNVFIGANSTILYDVTIGNNVIIGAGSLVNKDIPEGTVCAGVPCKVIGSFKELLEKRKHLD